MATNRPQFWLQVRKDYILDNFDNLIVYLRQYNYVMEESHPDYDSTLDCMTELSHDIGDVIMSTPFYSELNLGRDVRDVLRLFCATILASNKAHRTPHLVIVALLDLIMKARFDVGEEQLISFFNIILDCVREKPMLKSGFSWDDIIPTDPKTGLLIMRLCQMSFYPVAEDGQVKMIENKGFLAIPSQGMAELSALNRVNYEKSRLETQFILPGMLRVMVERKDFEKGADFDALYNLSSLLLSAQQQMKPSARRILKNYELEDRFVVKVVSKRGMRVDAVTIDPDYQRLEGKVLLSLGDKRPNWNVLNETITEGCYLTVYRSQEEEYEFEVFDAFEDFYRQYAAECAGMERYAKYSTYYGRGTEWVTEDGIRVGIDNGKINDLDDEQKYAFDSAVENGGVIELKLYDRPPRMDGETFFVYAEPTGRTMGLDGQEEFSIGMADKQMIEEYLDESAAGGHQIEEKGKSYRFVDADSRLCAPLVTVLARQIDGGLPSCRARLEYITAAEMLCNVTGLPAEMAYMDHERRFLYAQVQFAHDKPLIPLNHDPLLNDVRDVVRRERIVNTLRSYRKKEVATTAVVERPERAEDTLEKVATLVTASNSLVGIIDNLELNNIKQAIARALSIEDEYVSILDDRTFYGTESINLEFKTSVVFPPANRRRLSSAVADPDMQKWAIIKAVCGFLNSRSGGELLLGVNDAGYAVGLEEDMRKLTELHQISSPTIDHYRTYLQFLLDYAFREHTGKVSSTDISRLCIKYLPEENAEGKTIMRIQLMPYSRGIVSLAGADRPQGMEECYVRLSGRTVPVTPAMSNVIMSYKIPE